MSSVSSLENCGGKSSSSRRKRSSESDGKRGTKIYILGFSSTTVPADLEKHFDKYGEIAECSILANRYGCSYSFLTFKRNVSISRILADGPHYIGGRELLVRETEDKTSERRLFCTGLPERIDEKQLEKYFEKFGAVEYASVTRDLRGFPSGKAFITFETKSSAQKARNYGKHKIDGRYFECETYYPKSKPAQFNKPIRRIDNMQYKIFVKGYSSRMLRRGDVADYFERYGEILNVEDAGDHCFIEFRSRDAVKRVLRKTHAIDNYPLKVDEPYSQNRKKFETNDDYKRKKHPKRRSSSESSSEYERSRKRRRSMSGSPESYRIGKREKL